MGYPGDFDPRDEEPEWTCLGCGGIVFKTGKHEAECSDCGTTYEADADPS
jgi:hypothetical protein